MASSWLPKPSPKDTSNQDGLVALIPFHLHQHHSIFIIKTCLYDQQTSQRCWMVGDVQTWPLTSTPGTRSGTTVRPILRPGATRVVGGATPVTFALIRLWIQKWPKFSINFLVSGINVWEIRRFLASTPWSMALQGTRGHTKINLPVFKDEYTKDAVMYQSWHWDLTVYHHPGCWDCSFLPYAICSLEG